ncbi:hypothetical protein SSS_06329 [Sarcoptes scabiei]|uniref:CCHC-type domain-containing protein n=1 Tax=Sarcoptes scabiei TaxID=52283 RepID=A0A834R0S3_SARSC|nr:hypothetical protein SSS_06329 [Sarcoptes scabiei]
MKDVDSFYYRIIKTVKVMLPNWFITISLNDRKGVSFIEELIKQLKVQIEQIDDQAKFLFNTERKNKVVPQRYNRPDYRNQSANYQQQNERPNNQWNQPNNQWNQQSNQWIQPRREINCYKCGKFGHIAYECRSSSNYRTVAYVEQPPSISNQQNQNEPKEKVNEQPKPSTSQNIVKVNCILNDLAPEFDPFRLNAILDGKKINFLLDTGAHVNLLPMKIVLDNNFQMKKLDEPFRCLLGGGNHTTMHYCELSTTIGKLTKTVKYFVLPTYDIAILGNGNFELFELNVKRNGIYQELENETMNNDTQNENCELPSTSMPSTNSSTINIPSSSTVDSEVISENSASETLTINSESSKLIITVNNEAGPQIFSNEINNECEPQENEEDEVDTDSSKSGEEVNKFSDVFNDSDEVGRISNEYFRLHLNSENRIKPLQSNSESESKTNVEQVRPFIGQVNYYQRFISNKVNLCAPFIKLNKNNMVEVKRKKKLVPIHQSKLKLFFMMLLITLATLLAEKISIQKHEPILWRKTNYRVIEHLEYNIVKVYIMTPCETLAKIRFNNSAIIPCREEYNQQVQHIQVACNSKIKTARALGVLGTAVTVIVTQSLMGLADLILHRDNTESKVSNLQIAQATMADRIRKIEQITEQEINKFIKNEVKLIKLIEDTEEEIMKFDRFMAKLMIRGRAMERLFQEASFGRVSTDFQYLFPNVFNESNGDPNSWKFVSCTTRTMSKMYFELEMKIITPKVSPNFSIWKAVPFNIYKPNDKGYCRYKYSGPQLLCHDHTKNCPKGIETNNIEKQISITDIDDECLRESTDDMWKLNQCGFKKPKTQIKYDENFAYAYCLGATLEFPYFNVTCENFVYKIPRNVSFTTNDSTTDMGLQERIIQVPQSYSLNTSKINKHIFTNQSNYNFELKELSELIEENESPRLYLRYREKNIAIDIIVGIIALAMIGTFIAFKVNQRRKKMKKQHMERRQSMLRDSIRKRVSAPPAPTSI